MIYFLLTDLGLFNGFFIMAPGFAYSLLLDCWYKVHKNFDWPHLLSCELIWPVEPLNVNGEMEKITHSLITLYYELTIIKYCLLI